ncbi:MAG: hypothetical protein ACXW2C_05145 [Acidimicrobiia bacterium]
MAVLSVFVAMALVVAGGCGGSEPGRGGAGPDDSPVTSPSTDLSTPDGSTSGGAQLVEPRPGMADVRPVRFDAAHPVGDGRTLEIRFTGGVAPCFVLDRVSVDEQAERVVVTLFAGRDADAGDVACIELAALYATRVPLDDPLGSRAVVDGAA